MGELDISHALLDLVTQMRDDNVCRHLPLTKCTKRDQEVLGIKKAPELKDYVADIGSTRKFGQAFQRRALAFDMADLCSYEAQMVIVDRYIELIGDGRATMEQTMRADEMLSIELAKVCRTGIKGRPGASPVGDNMERVFELQQIQ